MQLYNKTIFVVVILLYSFLSYGQNSSEEVSLLLSKTRSYLDSRPDSSLYYSKLTIDKALANKNYWAVSKSLTYSGWVKKEQGKFNTAIIDFYEALRWIQQADTADYYNNGVITRNIASIQIDFRNYKEAITYYDSSLFYFKRHVTVHPEIATRYNDYQQIYEGRYYRAQALWQNGQLLKSQRELVSLLNDQTTPISTKVNANYQFGFIYNEMKRMDSAILFFEKGLSVEGISKQDQGKGTHNLAMTYFRKKEYEKAIKLYRSAIEVKKDLKNNKSLFISVLDLGESLILNGQTEEAFQVFEEALTILDEQTVVDNPKYYTIFQFMSRCLIHSNSMRSEQFLIRYVDCTKEFQRVQEALRNEDRKRAFDLLMENHAASVKHKNQLDSLVNKYGLWLLVVLAAAVTASVLGVKSFLVYRRKQRSKKINRAIRPRKLRTR